MYLFQTKCYAPNEAAGVGFGGSDQGSANVVTDRLDIQPGSVTPAKVEPETDKAKVPDTEQDKFFGPRQPIDEEPGEQAKEVDPLKLDEYYADDKEFLEELGITGHETVKDALLALKTDQAAFTRSNQIASQIEDVAKALGATPTDVVEMLKGVDPRSQAGLVGPQFENLNRYIGGLKFEDGVDIDGQRRFYGGLAGAMIEDISPVLTGKFGRILNSFDSRFAELQTDMQLMKFVGNNPDWKGREEEIKATMSELKKPSIDRAVAILKAGKETRTEQTRAREIARAKLKEIQGKRQAADVEPLGRAKPPGRVETDPDRMSSKQLETLIDDAERRGQHFIPG